MIPKKVSAKFPLGDDRDSHEYISVELLKEWIEKDKINSDHSFFIDRAKLIQFIESD